MNETTATEWTGNADDEVPFLVGEDLIYNTSQACGCYAHDYRSVQFRRYLDGASRGYAEVFTCRGSRDVAVINLSRR